MSRIILVTGGARSGKSRHAEALVRAMPGPPIYIATAEAGDDAEMQARIAHHVDRRGAGWTTVEEPLDLAGALDRSDGEGPRLVDCLTLWLSNHMFADRPWEPEADTLIAALGRQRSPVVLVSNEVGMGIVPDNALARAFRDAQGFLNQRVAEVADEVMFVAAGLPLRLK
ncbi:Adenosylcobinamide-phosphate guanylyltransferase [Rhodovulum sp. P5]|uniref:bifunctional adenosylcobinamide kinase/adenosylcobinamide-phosphate guanylyltransferase n=1 Tax=Rhodovulum sp. P5 TaxID=1564506 RepID=UPI0009C39274|nr:bifunctional adenosylcobinamide kinase/adenosylcobinamide-phosphate guanylyltransferase [Rhodovulum sp. P5]ARE40488.1 Adenosylcobinamide-phosphate guanylyltransferase [Rhodovulum sp. P5]